MKKGSVLFQTPQQNSASNLKHIVVMKIQYVKYAMRYDNFVSYKQINHMDTWIPGISASVTKKYLPREKKNQANSF